jgi:hypothetical protein
MSAMYMPAGYQLKGETKYDGRICFSLQFFTHEEDAAACAQEVWNKGLTYNGGWLDGRQCGREPQFDHDADGKHWIAVSC